MIDPGSRASLGRRSGKVACSNVRRDPAAIAGRWLRWAQEDLTVAERIAVDDEVVPRAACVFAHQAAEKAIKALLVDRGTDPPKLHDLDRLAARLPEDDNVRFDSIDLPELTRWAIEGRYPDDAEEATPADSRQSIVVAREVLEAVRQAMAIEP